MSDAFPNRPTTLADYLAIFRRRLWIVLLPLVLVPALSLVLSARQKPLYKASSEIYVQRDPASGDRDPVRYLNTLASVVRDPKLAARVVANAGVSGMTPESFLDSSSVTPNPDADLLEVAVTNLEPQSAVRLVNTYAREMTKYITEWTKDGAA
jgi:capsular polysaccharide biosynthesis protein